MSMIKKFAYRMIGRENGIKEQSLRVNDGLACFANEHNCEYLNVNGYVMAVRLPY